VVVEAARLLLNQLVHRTKPAVPAGVQGWDSGTKIKKANWKTVRIRFSFRTGFPELKTKGSDARRNLDFWGQVGVGAVALGCVSAAALGQVAVGIP
jgi:hypothetical protein